MVGDVMILMEEDATLFLPQPSCISRRLLSSATVFILSGCGINDWPGEVV
jgi:hypothetical protein